MPKFMIETMDIMFQEVWYTNKDWLCASEDKKCLLLALLFRPGISQQLADEVSVSPWHFKFVKDFLYHLEYYDIYAFRQIIFDMVNYCSLMFSV